MSTKCNNVITIKQYGPTCWFNSILMAVLYSENSRKMLLEKSKKWNSRINIFKTLLYILKNKYLRTDNLHNDYLYFDKIRPEYILKLLYKYDKKKFIFNPEKYKTKGYKTSLYIRKVYKLMGANVLFLDYDKYNNKLYYSLNNNYELKGLEDNKVQYVLKYKTIYTIEQKMRNPDVIIISLKNNNDFNKHPSWYLIEKDKYPDIYNSVLDLNNNIKYNNNEYIQDSVLLNNWNSSVGSHSIAGIKCNNEKYVYNGWSRSTIDPNIIRKEYNNDNIDIPCELIKYNWNLEKSDDFCLNTLKCKLDIMSTMNNLCFNFSQGTREIIYIKNIYKSAKDNNIIQKVCPKGKVLNPLTNRCIKINEINKLKNIQLSKPVKVCPEGKVLNPLTNRCIKIKAQKPANNPANKPSSKPKKICPEGKVLNPLTNRCIKIKAQKPANNPANKPSSKPKKICPEGKVLNPLTNRCIKKRS